MIEFQAWPKTPRLFRDMIISEKIDGTNAAIVIWEGHPTDPDDDCTITRLADGRYLKVGAQSRKRVITPTDDNFGFAAWVFANAEGLADTLGEGRHYGEWWGSGIQRGYHSPGLYGVPGIKQGQKRFSLFNVKRYQPLLELAQAGDSRPYELHTVPVLHEGPFNTTDVLETLGLLAAAGSVASPGFMKPEGIVVYHSAANSVFKVTIEGDETPKSVAR